MKKAILIALGFFTLISFSQEKIIDIDYTVDYIIHQKRKKNVDTITIGFNKKGKYLWTNSNVIGKDFSAGFFFNDNEDSANTNLIYSSENGRLIMLVNEEENRIYIDFDVKSILPSRGNSSEKLNLITEPIDLKEKLLGRDLSAYNLFPDTEPDQPLTILMDESLECDNNAILIKFIDLLLNNSTDDSAFTFNIPNGLILKVLIEGETLIEAHKINIKPKQIIINHSFQIKE
ncbi:hypothetical protein [Winogradskyella sp. 3972H.M.0a.05]|uniref:hypothetical protein n=1 Tax=Winogradskyella sp. 3972H.M.0a.05 TaxID=2950277 RepID=UPI003393FC29